MIGSGEKIIISIETKKCTNTECETGIYPATEEFFYRQKNYSKKRGIYYTLSANCRKCRIKESQKYASEHRDEKLIYYKKYNKFDRDQEKEKIRLQNRYKKEKPKLQERLRLWQKSEKGKKNTKKNNEKRIKEKKHEVSDLEWFYCRYYFNNSCAYCGISWEEHMTFYKQDLHKEHVVHDGRNDLKNCVPSCKSCNSEKHESTLNEWYNIHNPKYNRIRYLRIYQWLRWEVLKFVEPKKF